VEAHKAARVGPALGGERPSESAYLCGKSGFVATPNHHESQAGTARIDLGNRGGVSLHGDDGSLVDSIDMAILHDGSKGRASVNASLLAENLARWQVRRAFIEHVGVRPGEGAVGAFAFGRSRGVVEGVCAALGISVTSSHRRLGSVSSEHRWAKPKDVARSEAIRRWPDKAALFARVKDAGRADAELFDDDRYDALVKFSDRAISWWLSIREASYRRERRYDATPDRSGAGYSAERRPFGTMRYAGCTELAGARLAATRTP
jgi:crossover junction endodeoxyribonuclease RuvC